MFISFCVAAWNVQKYISECLDSILQQTIDDYEIVVVDDGSSDGTSEICDQYAQEYKQIRVIHIERQGVSVARNTAIEEARGEWIFFVDGDDVVAPDAVDYLRNKLDISQYNTVQYSYKTFRDGQDYKAWKQNDVEEREEDNAVIMSRTIKTLVNEPINVYRYSTIWGKLFRRRYLIENGYRFVRNVVFSQDVLFNMLVFDVPDKTILSTKKLYGYRLNSGAIASRYSPDLHRVVLFVRDCFMESVEHIRYKDSIDQLEKRVALRIFIFLEKVIRCDICHDDNHKRFSERKKDFEELLKQESVCQYLHNLDSKDVGKKQYVTLYCMKHMNFALLNVDAKFTKRMQKVKRFIITSCRKS